MIRAGAVTPCPSDSYASDNAVKHCYELENVDKNNLTYSVHILIIIHILHNLYLIFDNLSINISSFSKFCLPIQ
jgi:hypothetical protein